MTEQQDTWFARLAAAVENCNHSEDPETAFADLVAHVLTSSQAPLTELVKIAELQPGQEALVRGWASGAVMPTAKVRRKVVAGVRARFSADQKAS